MLSLRCRHGDHGWLQRRQVLRDLDRTPGRPKQTRNAQQATYFITSTRFCIIISKLKPILATADSVLIREVFLFSVLFRKVPLYICTYVPFQIPYTTSPIPIPKSHRSNDSDVRQMAAPSCRVIGHDDITLMNIITKGLHLVLYGLLHGPQVHGYVWGVGNQTPVRAKKSTRKIQSLLESGNVTLCNSNNAVRLSRGTSTVHTYVSPGK